MTVLSKTPKQALNDAYRKLYLNENEIELFKKNLLTLLDKIDVKEYEEHAKNNIRDFLLDTYYKDKFYINTKDRNDLVIHSGKSSTDPVSVIIEAKSPSNKLEFPTQQNINVKAMQELVLYYLKERLGKDKNKDIRNLIITNGFEWFIFDGKEFYKNFYDKTKFRNEYISWSNNQKDSSSTDMFYRDIASNYLEKIKNNISFVYFNINDYKDALNTNDNEIIHLYKILSPEHLLKLPFANDSNTLDKNFYFELLHIIGLEEVKVGGKKVIQRKKKPDEGSLLENTINILISEDRLHKVDNPGNFGETHEEQYFGIALELCITWINRILFLKLLEAQLLKYFKDDEAYKFLYFENIGNYDALNKLFFQVLAVKPENRSDTVKEKFSKVPYLNSSLFEINHLEDDTIRINSLEDDPVIPIISKTVLTKNGKKVTGNITTLKYLFDFLEAYDFSSEGSEKIQKERKTLINASVLGLIFEKINGYKDGSFFTPGFITMYMARETVRRAVIQKFNDIYKKNIPDFNGLKNFINSYPRDTEMVLEFNKVINSLKICDPAVGSGHFLVSALNEIIAIKSDLQILADREGVYMYELVATVENDELSIKDKYTGDFFKYIPGNKYSQKIQEALFHEKQAIIENCLFGVDINHNSVKICRLRLWIELLKNAYYTKESGYKELETLPNIDINIKCGNSLVSRFSLDADISSALRKSKWNITGYRLAVQSYQNARTKDEKRELEKLIDNIKNDFRTEISTNDPKQKRLDKLSNEYYEKFVSDKLIQVEMSAKDKVREEKQKKKLTKEIDKLANEIKEIKESAIYRNAFEWRFEFPEVLDEKGSYIGFDVVIGNPPWGATLSYEVKQYLKRKYDFIDSSTPNTYAYFLGIAKMISRGIIMQLLPDSILVKDYAKTRILFRESLEEISWFQNSSVPDVHRPFKDVEHDVCSLLIGLEPRETCKVISRSYSNGEVSYVVRKMNKGNFIIDEYESVYNLLMNDTDIRIYKKCSKYEQLGNFLQCHEGIHTGNIRDKLFTREQITGEEKPLFLGGRSGDLVGNYISQRKGGWYVNYNNDLIDIDKKEYASLRDERIFIYPKIYITRTGNPLKAFIDLDNYASNNFFSIQFSDYDLNSYERLKPILAVLNSNFANYYIRKIIAPSIGSIYTETKIIHLMKLPFTNNIIESNELRGLVTEILEIKQENFYADTKLQEDKIDKLVDELYGLTDEEIEIVERG